MSEYIDRAALGIGICNPNVFNDRAYGYGWNAAVTIVRDAPTADVAPVRHGHWIAKEDYNLDIYYDCSVCGESWMTVEGEPWDNGMNYCPHCGARMDGAE